MRAATATIDLAALRHNLAMARARGAGAKVVAVVKANGYGHGAARLLPALTGADMLGVACIEEALALREAGAAQPILLLEGVFEADELPLCARLGFEIAVHEPGQLAMLEAARLERPLTAWLKVDSGMNRLGFRPEEASAALARLRDCAAVAPSHPPDDPFRQRRRADRARDPRADRPLRRCRPEPRPRALASATRPACSPGRKPMPNGSALASCSTASRRWPGAPAMTRGCARS